VHTRRLWKSLAKRRILSSAIVALAALCTLAIGVGWWLASQPPEWWAEIDTEAPETIATSRDVENWAISTMTQGRTGNGLWAVTLTEEDANTWLAIRLPMWVISEHGKWPDGIHRVRVRFADNRIIIGADIRDPDSPTPRVIAAALKLHFNDSGAVRAQIEWTQFNRLKLPGAAGVSRLRTWIEEAGEADELAEQIASLLRGDMQADSLGWKLEDGRRITVHHLHVKDGEVKLTCSTASAR